MNFLSRLRKWLYIPHSDIFSPKNQSHENYVAQLRRTLQGKSQTPQKILRIKCFESAAKKAKFSENLEESSESAARKKIKFSNDLEESVEVEDYDSDQDSKVHQYLVLLRRHCQKTTGSYLELFLANCLDQSLHWSFSNHQRTQ